MLGASLGSLLGAAKVRYNTTAYYYILSPLNSSYLLTYCPVGRAVLPPYARAGGAIRRRATMTSRYDHSISFHPFTPTSSYLPYSHFFQSAALLFRRTRYTWRCDPRPSDDAIQVFYHRITFHHFTPPLHTLQGRK
jgi:hypothetical protein